MPDWHRIKWYGVLAIGVSFSVGGIAMAVSGNSRGWVVFFFFLFCAAMAVHELWPQVVEGRPTLPDTVLQRFPGPVTLRTPRRKLIFFLVSTIVFGGCLFGLALSSDMSAVGLFFMWLGAIGCAAAIPAFLLSIIRGSALRLGPDGMQIFHGLKRSTHRWSDLRDFSVADVGMPMVVFDENSRTDGVVGAFNRSQVGRGGGLPDTYGMDAWHLAWLLNEWRTRALAATSQPPSQSSPAP